MAEDGPLHYNRLMLWFFFPFSIIAVPFIWTGEIVRFLFSFGERKPNFHVELLRMELFFTFLFNLSFWAGLLFWICVSVVGVKSYLSRYDSGDYDMSEIPSSKSNVERRQDILDINEAIIKFYLAGGGYFPESIESAEVIFIQAAPHVDPPDDFMRQFSNVRRPVKKVSEADLVFHPQGGLASVTDKTSKKRGCLFSIDDGKFFRWKNQDEVMVGNIFLEKKKRKWRVVHFAHVFGV